MKTIKINGKKIGEKEKTFIIAEGGINHNGDIKIAKELISAAAESNADAIKFQIFDTELFYSTSHKGFAQTGKDIIKLLKSLEFSEKEWLELKEYADKKNIIFFASIFDNKSFDISEKLNIPVYKVASGDINFLLFLKKIGKTGKPIILSTGMSNMKDISNAVLEIEKTGNKKISILQCISLYPAPYNLINLKTIKMFNETFGYPTGLSDHTEGYHISLAAVAMGANIIEKHFTLDKKMNGPDHKLSISPDEFKDMVKQIRDVEKAIGDGYKTGGAGDEKKSINLARRGLYAKKTLKAGDILSMDNTIFKRPAADFIKPEDFQLIIGRKLKKGKEANEGIKYRDLV
jgi:sialic acid synthase SpsE